MNRLLKRCRIITEALGNWLIQPPAGQVTRIGSTGAVDHGLTANDDLFVSGKFVAKGTAYFDGIISSTSSFNSSYGRAVELINLVGEAKLQLRQISDELTIPVASGMAGVNTGQNLAVAHSIIIAAAVRVTQAPGGGATEFDLGRTGGNTDEFIDGLGVALGTTGTSPANGDGVNAGPVHNAADNTLVVTTDANVTITDMKVRIDVWYWQIIPATG